MHSIKVINRGKLLKIFTINQFIEGIKFSKMVNSEPLKTSASNRFITEL